jgi:uncharacterized protein YrrD
MKKTQEILGLAVISISDGVEVGKVKGIILNAEGGAIDYIIVDSGIQALNTRVISTESILGIGEYALTIESEAELYDINKVPEAVNLLNKDIRIKGTKVLTKKGRMIGAIGDIYVEEEEKCIIVGAEFISDKNQQPTPIIPRENIITFGKNLIVVTDDVEESLVEDFLLLSSSSNEGEIEKKNLVQFEVEQKNATIVAFNENTVQNTADEDDYSQYNGTEIAEAQSDEDVIQKDASIGTEVQSESAPAIDSENSASSLFELRQRQYLIGRKSTKTVYDNDGNVIVDEGTVLNEEIISMAKQNGKMIELVMNNKA